jgi:tetratricopeptide (TPR) repeat protein
VNRTITSLALALAAMVAVPAPHAWADTPPSQADLAGAKKAFQEADVLYKAGKIAEAIEKLKESYRLSQNAFLLYNIGRAYDQLGQTEMVLMYYQKFLAAAPANAPMRPDVQKRVTAIEKEKADAAQEQPENTTPPPNTPASKYSATDFKHTVIDTAPPAQPIDVTATVPDDAGWTVTLNYRRAGEDTYTIRPMQKRGTGTELVARINRPKVAGHSIQYYVEVKDSAGNVVTRAGKRLSPNLIYIEKTAQPHYDTTVNEPEDGAPIEQVPEQGPLRTDFGFGSPDQVDQPTRPYTKAKWIATGAAGAALAFSFVSVLEARHEHELLRQDSVMCGTPPCRVYDEAYDHRIQTLGQRWDATYKVSLGVGVAAAAVAGYFWYRNHTFKVVPAADSSSAGAVAVGSF